MSSLVEALLNAQPSLSEGQSFERQFPKGLERTEGYVPTGNPVSVSVSAAPQIPSPLPVETETARRWEVYDEDGNYTWKCHTGKVWQIGANGALSEAIIADANASFSIADGGKLYLECEDNLLTGLTLMSGNVTTVYEQSGGNLTAARYVIGEFSSTDPGVAGIPLDTGNTTLYYRPLVGDHDLVAHDTVRKLDGTTIWAVAFGPY